MRSASATAARLIPDPARPGVYLAPSRADQTRVYQVRNVGTPFVECDCPAGEHNRECAHVIAALELTVQEDTMASETPLRERLDPANEPAPTGTLVRVDQAHRAELLRQTAAQQTGSYGELLPLAQAMSTAGLLPVDERKGPMKPEAAALVMMRALELGIPPMSAFETLYVVGNKVKLQGQMVQALIQRDGRGRIEIEETSNIRCTAVGIRPGYRPLRVTFTIEDAQKASIIGGFGWQKYPADMLRWKVIARIGRLLFADLLGGMDVADAQGGTLDRASVPYSSLDADAPAYGGGHTEVIGGEWRPAEAADPLGEGEAENREGPGNAPAPPAEREVSAPAGAGPDAAPSPAAAVPSGDGSIQVGAESGAPPDAVADLPLPANANADGATDWWNALQAGAKLSDLTDDDMRAAIKGVYSCANAIGWCRAHHTNAAGLLARAKELRH